MNTPPKKRAFRIGKRKTVQDVVAETAKLYRRTVHGHVDSNDAARQSGILANIRQGMEQSLIELRLTAIEDTILKLAANQNRAPMLYAHWRLKMSASLKRLEKIEAALEQLLAKDKAYLLCYKGNDMEAEIQWHIDVGKYDPATQEAVIIMAWGPRPRPDPKTYRKGWTSELPAAPKRSLAAEIIEEINELPRSGGHDPAGPRLEPTPEPRRRIHYPNMGIV